MLARDEVEAYYFGRYDERLMVLDYLREFLDDPRPTREVLEEIIARILKG